MSRSLFDPELSYGCIQCGRSCTGWNVWLTPEIAEGARRLPVTLRIIEERGAAFEQAEQGLRMVRDEKVFRACGYLREDHLCSIHAQLGYAAKPAGCRQFPYLVTLLPDGSERIGASFSCTAVRRKLGPPLLENSGEVEQLRGLGLARMEVAEPLAVVPGLDWSWKETSEFEQRFEKRVQELGWQQALFDALLAVGRMVRESPEEPGALEGQLGLLGQVLLVGLLKPCLNDHDRALWQRIDQGFLGEGDLILPEYAWDGPVAELQAYIADEVGQRFDADWDDFRRALWFRKAHLLLADVPAGLLMLWSLRDILRLLTGLHAWREKTKPAQEHVWQALDTVETGLLAHSQNGSLVYAQMSRAWLGLARQA